MKALTICQPYASLIANPPHVKRIENRTWETLYRGPIAIHAGKSTKWLRGWDGPRPDPMPFGAIVAVAELVACVNHFRWCVDPWPVRGITLSDLTAMMHGQFAEGPFCWILDNIRPLEKPIPRPGAVGLWELPIHMGVLLPDRRGA